MEAVVRIRAPRWWQRRRFPPLRDGVHCTLADDARVRFYSADFAVTVESESVGTAVSSAENGSIEFTRASDGRRFETRTAPLYLAAAERQGIEVEVIDGGGYWSE